MNFGVDEMIGVKDSVIPDMIHPLGKHWNQPNREDIAIDGIHALMSKNSFDRLHTYSTSIPTGVYEGKMWKRRRPDAWYLLWYSECEDVDSCSINIRKIIIVE